MKKILIIITAMSCISISTNAQTKGIWLSIHNNTSLMSYEDGKNPSVSYNIGVGADVIYMLSKKVGVSTGFNYQYFAHESYDNGFQIPVSFRFVSSNAKNKYFAQGSITFGFLNDKPRQYYHNVSKKSKEYIAPEFFVGRYIIFTDKISMTVGPHFAFHLPNRMITPGLKIGLDIKPARNK